jgi:hypothetical protein
VAPAAPVSVVGNNTNGVVTVVIGTSQGQVPASVKLFAGTADITSKYVADTSVAGKVVFTPVIGQVVFSGQVLKATVADSTGNVSGAATSAGTYTFANPIALNASKASTTFNAAGGDFAYNVGEGTYKTSISGFGPGDSLLFFGSKVAILNLVNTSGADGVVLITGTVDGQVVDVTLTGLSPN